MRIGLVGYSCASGLGELNHQIATHVDIHHWIVKPHKVFGVGDPVTNVQQTVLCDQSSLESFVLSVDTVVFGEVPYFPGLVDLAKAHGRRTVCIPMAEWIPADLDDWFNRVDLHICPTVQCYNKVRHLGVPCVHLPWPVDTERFKFTRRDTCSQFLFLNGHGGWGGRKGADVVRKAKEMWPGMPLIVRSQVPADWPQGTVILQTARDNSTIYSDGDVLIAPHSTDGIGLELLEAMSCGMPVVSTYGEPWNEMPAVERIYAETKESSRSVEWYNPHVESLVECCKSLLGRSIAEQSYRVRQWAEDRSWNNLRQQFINLVTGTS